MKKHSKLTFLITTSKTKFAIIAACVLAASQVANAAFTISGSVGGAPTGVHKVNFDDLFTGDNTQTATSPNGTVGISFITDGQVVQGSSQGQYAAPWLSGGNGNGFGPLGGNQVDGADATTYLTSGGAGGEAILSFGASEKYLGLLWGSVDPFNTLTFYSGGTGGTVVGTVTGSQAIASPNGNQGVNGTVYVNISSDTAFDTVVATSSEHAFEFDNVAYNETSVVPEPTTLLAGAMLLLPFGVSALRIVRRNRKA